MRNKKACNNCKLLSRFILVSATRLTLTSKIAIGFRSGVRHRLALMSKITIRLTMSRLLNYHKYNIYNYVCQHKKVKLQTKLDFGNLSAHDGTLFSNIFKNNYSLP